MLSISFSEEKTQLWFSVCGVWMLSECDRLWQAMETEKKKTYTEKVREKTIRYWILWLEGKSQPP